jgi:tryptophan synthase alpha chain
VAQEATGFVYMVSMTGVTGGAMQEVAGLAPLIDIARQASKLPVCLGFGVRDRVTARRAAAVADGVVVGSAVVRALEAGDGTPIDRVRALVAELRAGVDGR